MLLGSKGEVRGENRYNYGENRDATSTQCYDFKLRFTSVLRENSIAINRCLLYIKINRLGNKNDSSVYSYLTTSVVQRLTAWSLDAEVPRSTFLGLFSRPRNKFK